MRRYALLTCIVFFYLLQLVIYEITIYFILINIIL